MAAILICVFLGFMITAYLSFNRKQKTIRHIAGKIDRGGMMRRHPGETDLQLIERAKVFDREQLREEARREGWPAEDLAAAIRCSESSYWTGD